MDKRTFAQRYQDERNKPTPAQIWITEVAAATQMAEGTVRLWACGAVRPSKLARKTLAEHFQTTEADLFPEWVKAER